MEWESKPFSKRHRSASASNSVISDPRFIIKHSSAVRCHSAANHVTRAREIPRDYLTDYTRSKCIAHQYILLYEHPHTYIYIYIYIYMEINIIIIYIYIKMLIIHVYVCIITPTTTTTTTIYNVLYNTLSRMNAHTSPWWKILTIIRSKSVDIIARVNRCGNRGANRVPHTVRVTVQA